MQFCSQRQRPNAVTLHADDLSEEEVEACTDFEDLRPVKVSTISFVDLAGSERGTVSGQESSMERVRQTEVNHCCTAENCPVHKNSKPRCTPPGMEMYTQQAS